MFIYDLLEEIEENKGDLVIPPLAYVTLDLSK